MTRLNRKKKKWFTVFEPGIEKVRHGSHKVRHGSHQPEKGETHVSPR